jgi:hypothetical protein
MGFELVFFNSSIIEKQAVDRILECNEQTSMYGLVLTKDDAVSLVETRNHSLNANGRVEFGGGVINKVIQEFCDSPFLSMHNYVETLNELLEIFYYYKNETLDLISDDDLIQYMKNAFDGVCKGSLELLAGRELYRLAKNLRYGYDPDYSDDIDDIDDEEEYDG